MHDGTFFQYRFGDENDPKRDVMTFRAVDHHGGLHDVAMDGRDVRAIAMFFESDRGLRHKPTEYETGCHAVVVVTVPEVRVRTIGPGGERGWFSMSLEVFNRLRADLQTIGRRIVPWTTETTFAGSDPRRVIWRAKAGDRLQGPGSVRAEPELRDPTGC